MYFKRFLEIVISILILIILSPFILVIVLLIKSFFKEGKIIFKQKRVGKDKKLFTIYKFRTMTKNAEKELANILKNNPNLKEEYAKTCKLKNDPRVMGKLGFFLRKTSLDELPQFFNIIKGDMTFVGPRPFLEKEICNFENEYKQLCSVKPGLTGLWQVSGRNHLDLKQRIALDIKYINNKSLLNDIKIIFKTFLILFQKKGVY